MMNVLGCLDLPTTGTYTLDGEAVAGLDEDQLARVRNRKIGFIFQSFYLMPRTTIADNVAQPLIYRGIAPAVRRERANAALARVGLDDAHAAQAQRAVRRPAPARGDRARAGRPARTCCWPTSPPATSTARPRARSWASSASCMREGMTIMIVTHDRGGRRLLPARGAPARRPHRRKTAARLERRHERRRIADRRRQPPAGAALRAAGMRALRARQHPVAPHAQLPHHARRHHRRGVGDLHHLAGAGPHAVR